MKRACITATPEFLAGLCKPVKKLTLSIDSDLPDDAVFVGTEYLGGLFYLVFEHDSFEDIDISDGIKYPILKPPVFTELD